MSFDPSGAEYMNHRPPVDNLIPIRLDIEADGQRYKDVFTWNVDGRSKNGTFPSPMMPQNAYYLVDMSMVMSMRIPP